MTDRALSERSASVLHTWLEEAGAAKSGCCGRIEGIRKSLCRVCCESTHLAAAHRRRLRPMNTDADAEADAIRRAAAGRGARKVVPFLKRVVVRCDDDLREFTGNEF